MNRGKVPFLDLSRQESDIGKEIGAAVDRVLQSGNFILGSEVESFEKEFAAYCGSSHGIGVASGTDALVLALKASGLEPGEDVLVPAFSAPPTAVAVALAGGHPVFVDIDPITFNIDCDLIDGAIGPRTRFLVAVHLYGNCVNMPALMATADRHGLTVIEDCAQAHGAAVGEKMAGTWGRAGAYSFYPTKNLGACGDGGMVVTADEGLSERLRMLRNYGKNERDRLQEVGWNSRLDELQAAVLRVKLSYLDDWNRLRKQLASRYFEGLHSLPLNFPDWDGGDDHCFHLFVIASEARDELIHHLAKYGIETSIHYPVPLHLQEPFIESSVASCPQAEWAAKSVLSLPLYPELKEEEQELVIQGIRDFYR